METLTYTLNRWTTKELVGEVVRRTATDGPGLQLVEGMIIRARLAESDRKFGQFELPAELGPAIEQPGVRGTMEMGLADDDEGPALLAKAGHDVDAAIAGAHTHDHSHRRRPPEKRAAHDHYHLHLSNVEADGQLNGHNHAPVHARLPWEQGDSA